MKKILCYLLLLFVFFMQMPVWAASSPQKKSYQRAKTAYKKTYPKKNTPKKAPAKPKEENQPKEDDFQIPLIEDTAAEALLDRDLEKNSYNGPELEDDSSDLLLKTSASKYDYNKTQEEDEPVVDARRADVKPAAKRVKIPKNVSVVYLKPVKKVSTRCKRVKVDVGEKNQKFSMPFPLIGQTVHFKVLNNVEENGKIVIPKGADVYASVGEVSPRAMGGVPAEMTLEKFYFKDKNGNIIELDGEISSSGYTLAVWIGLVELATTPFLIGFAAPLLRVLPGGQAIVTPRKTYAVYYKT